MIRHIVLIKFRSDVDEQAIADIFAALEALTQKLSGAHGFTGGRSDSPERIERGYKHGFVIDFDSWADLETYANHPEHKGLGALIVENAVAGVDGILVVDINTSD